MLWKQNVRGVISDLGHDFTGDSTPTLAKNMLEQAAKHVEFTFNRTINEYEQAFQNSQERIKADLHEEYLNHIASLFPDSRTLDLPIFKSLKKSIAAISLNIDLKSEDVSSRNVVTGYRTESRSTLWKPWTWFSSEEVPVYSKKEYVDLSDIWKERLISILSHFEELKNSAIHRIQDDKNKLIDNYLSFLDAEFTVRFETIIDALNQKAANKEQREAAIYQAKAELEEINKVKQELEAILQF